MAWYGEPENAAQIAAREKHKREINERQEALKQAEAAKDPYRRKCSTHDMRNFGDSVSRGFVKK